MQFFATLTIVFYCVPRCVSVLQFARPDLCPIHVSVRLRLRQQWFSEIWRLWRGIENERKMLRLRRLRRRRMLMLQAAFLASMNLKRSSSSLSNVLHSCKVCQLHLYTAYKTFVDVWVWMRSWNFWSSAYQPPSWLSANWCFSRLLEQPWAHQSQGLLPT